MRISEIAFGLVFVHLLQHDDPTFCKWYYLLQYISYWQPISRCIVGMLYTIKIIECSSINHQLWQIILIILNFDSMNFYGSDTNHSWWLHLPLWIIVKYYHPSFARILDYSLQLLNHLRKVIKPITITIGKGWVEVFCSSNNCSRKGQYFLLCGCKALDGDFNHYKMSVSHILIFSGTSGKIEYLLCCCVFLSILL